MTLQDPRSQPIIEVCNVSKEYSVGGETVVALRQINLHIMRGEICCIFGPSGSGKSTLLSHLSGLERPTQGEISIGGIPLFSLDEAQLTRFRQRHLGFVFQSYNLLPNLTATENVALPLMLRRIPKLQREQAARALLERVGLGHRLEHFPWQMSGGQQQRVSIARAFIARPDIVFADEPTGNLDSKSSGEIMELIRTFARDYHQTIVMVSHDPDMASYAHRIISLFDGEIVTDHPCTKERA